MGRKTHVELDDFPEGRGHVSVARVPQPAGEVFLGGDAWAVGRVENMRVVRLAGVVEIVEAAVGGSTPPLASVCRCSGLMTTRQSLMKGA